MRTALLIDMGDMRLHGVERKDKFFGNGGTAVQKTRRRTPSGLLPCAFILLIMAKGAPDSRSALSWRTWRCRESTLRRNDAFYPLLAW